MANRSHAFFRGLYANAQNQHLTNIVRRSGREAVASTDRAPKRKRTDEENVVLFGTSHPLLTTEPTGLENDLFSCLFDQDNRCTIFDLEDPSTKNVPSMEMEMERVKLSPCSIGIPSEPPALVQIDETPSVEPLPEEGGEDEGNEYSNSDIGKEVLSLFDPSVLIEDESAPAIHVPTMEMKRCKLSSARPKKPHESPALVQVNVTPTPAFVGAKAAPLTTKNTFELAPNKPRNRPFKNVRERRRRLDMKNKFMQLYNLCCCKAVTSLQPNPEATGLLIPISSSGPPLTLVNQEPSKVDILGEAIQAFEALDKELLKLRAHNRELRLSLA